MSDEIDQLNESVPLTDSIARYKSRRDVPDIEHPVGYCLNCGVPIQGKRWCDINCRNDWERFECNG